MSDLLTRMKRWLQYPRLSSGEKLMQEAVQEIERLQNNTWETNEQSEWRACQIDRLQRLTEYLEDPAVLLKIPPPIRLRISELLHGQ